MMLLSLIACQDQGFSEIKLDAIAVVQGDFDNLYDPLTALNINSQLYDGFIVQATYEPNDDRTIRGYGAPSVEGLLTATDEKGNVQIDLFGAVFVNSGTRGLGAYVYNDMLEPDNSLLADTEAMDHACSFVESGGTMVVSDWAYDLVEYCWPDAIEFYGDDATPDAAQVGWPDAAILADVNDELLVESLGSAVNLTYDFSAWSVIESVGSGSEVLLSGTVEYQPSADQLPESLSSAPLLVRLHPGRGQVLYSTFHIATQSPSFAETILLDGIEGLSEGAGEGSQAAGAGAQEDTGA